MINGMLTGMNHLPTRVGERLTYAPGDEGRNLPGYEMPETIEVGWAHRPATR